MKVLSCSEPIQRVRRRRNRRSAAVSPSGPAERSALWLVHRTLVTTASRSRRRTLTLTVVVLVLVLVVLGRVVVVRRLGARAVALVGARL